VNSQTVEVGEYVNRPANNPTKRGYNFVDWYTSPEYEYLFNFNIPITSSRTAYAKWVEGAPVITTDTLPDGVVNTAYSQTLTATGVAPITWSIDSGALPAGLTLSGTGTISGNPTTFGTSNFTVKAANAEGNDTKPLSITIPPPNAIPLTEDQWANGYTTYIQQSWFVFTATASTQYIHVSFGTLSSVYMQVYDSSGAAVGSETNLYGSTPSTSRSLTEGQTYYIRTGGYGGTYRIGFNTSTTAPTTQLPSDAIPLTENQWADGNLPTSRGVQWFTFTATASTQYLHFNPGTAYSITVQVYDSSGAAVGSQTQLSGSTISTSRSLTEGQTYYIRVWPYDSSYSGTYRIGFNTSFVPPDSTPIPLTKDIWADGSLPTSSDQQWFTFTATASTQYIDAAFGTLRDLYVQVYDSSGATVGSQTNLYGSTTRTSRSLTPGQTYYIRVWQSIITGSGSYSIRFA